MDALLQFLNVSTTLELWWVMIGFFGQSLFAMRFVIQWITSERAGRSVVPVSFWYFSVAGGFIMFLYAVYRQDPVFIVGQFAGLIIYARNLWLIHSADRPA